MSFILDIIVGAIGQANCSHLRSYFDRRFEANESNVIVPWRVVSQKRILWMNVELFWVQHLYIEREINVII